MKNILIIATILLIINSCKKVETNTVTKTVTNTVSKICQVKEMNGVDASGQNTFKVTSYYTGNKIDSSTSYSQGVVAGRTKYTYTSSNTRRADWYDGSMKLNYYYLQTFDENFNILEMKGYDVDNKLISSTTYTYQCN